MIHITYSIRNKNLHSDKKVVNPLSLQVLINISFITDVINP